MAAKCSLFSADKRWLLWGGSAVILVLLGLAAVYLPFLFTPILLPVAIGMGILLWRPTWFLVVLLLLRSSADISLDLYTFFPGRWYSFNAAGLLNILAVALAMILIARRFARGERWLPSVPLFLLAVFLLLAALGILTSIDAAASIKAWARTAGYLGVALLTCEAAQNSQNRLRILRVITLAAIPSLVLGYYQAFSGTGYQFPGYLDTPFGYRPQGTFAHPAILADFMIIVVCLAAAAFICKYPLWPRPVLAGLTAVCSGMLVLTFARTEWVGGIIAIAVISLIRYRRLLLITVLVGLVLVTAIPTIQTRLQGEQASESFEWRLQIWQASLKLLREPSWLGSGLDTSPEQINTVLVNVTSPPHNDYLRAAIESGMLGLAAFLLMQATMLHQAWQAYRQNSSPAAHTLGLALSGIIISSWVISLSDNYFNSVSPQWYLWAMIGLLAASSSKRTSALVISS